MRAPDPTLRIAVARARAAAFEEKARTYPERAAELTEMARKLKVAAALMERSGEQTPGQTASVKPSFQAPNASPTDSLPSARDPKP